MEYSNKTVYDFLIEECKTKPKLWAEFGTGLMKHSCDADFWESLSEELDCFRICEECGQPMIEGLHKHISEEDCRKAYNDGDTYWTTWYEDSNTYNRNN